MSVDLVDKSCVKNRRYTAIRSDAHIPLFRRRKAPDGGEVYTLHNRR